jgi:hypothetical protein
VLDNRKTGVMEYWSVDEKIGVLEIMIYSHWTLGA